MSEEKPSMLPKIEIFIIGGFFLLFMIWAISKCAATRKTYEKQAKLEAEEAMIADSIAAAERAADFVPLDTTIRPIKKNEAETADATQGVPLYVITPALNMRTGPGLRFKVLERLELYDELNFLGEVTDTFQRIDLGQIVAEEPWVKVRSASGKEGWVFGACVDYYKHELKGVEVD